MDHLDPILPIDIDAPTRHVLANVSSGVYHRGASACRACHVDMIHAAGHAAWCATTAAAERLRCRPWRRCYPLHHGTVGYLGCAWRTCAWSRTTRPSTAGTCTVRHRRTRPGRSHR